MSEVTQEKTPQAELWQEFLQKSCEVGQIDKHLEDLDSRKRELEKKLDVTKRQRNEAARKHDELVAQLQTKAEVTQ